MTQFTTAQVAQRAGVSARTVRRMVDRGELHPASKFPGSTGGYLFALTEVRRAFPNANLPHAPRGSVAVGDGGGPGSAPPCGTGTTSPPTSGGSVSSWYGNT